MPANYRTIIKGFTLIELIIVIAILVGMSVLLSGPLVDFYRTTVLNAATEDVLTTLEEARKNTLSSFNLDQYGVHFDADQLVLFKGATYSSSDSSNEVVKLHSFVEIDDIVLEGGGTEVLFDRLTGETSQYGSTTLRLKNGSSPDRIFNIFASGLIELK